MKTMIKTLAGTVAVGAMAMASATPALARDRDDYRYHQRHRGYDSPQSAVQQCVAAAQQTANRYSYGRNARVTRINDIDRKAGGYKVEGRIAVEARGGYYGHGWGRQYRNGWNRQYRGWNDWSRRYDTGSFKCRVSYGRIVRLDFDGIRGLG